MRRILTWLFCCGAILGSTRAADAHLHIDAGVGGEVLEVGTVFTIEWHIVVAHALENWDITYSTNGINGPWLPVVTDLPAGDPTQGSVHTYDWVVPNTVSSEVRIRVFMDNHGEHEDIAFVSPANLFIIQGSPATPLLTRGDCNLDGGFDLADAIALLGFLFNSSVPPSCELACDVNDDELVNIADAIYALGSLFGTEANPAAPFPHCGWDPTPSNLECMLSTGGC